MEKEFKKAIITKVAGEILMDKSTAYLIKCIVGVSDDNLTKTYNWGFFRANYFDVEEMVDGEVVTRKKLKIIEQKDKFKDPFINTYDEIRELEELIKPMIPQSLKGIDLELWKEKMYLLFEEQQKPSFWTTSDDWEILTDDKLYLNE